MILDTYDSVFVWIGRGANEVEKREALKTAKEYVQSDPCNRDLDSTLLIQVGPTSVSFPYYHTAIPILVIGMGICSLVVQKTGIFFYVSIVFPPFSWLGEARLRAPHVRLPLFGLEPQLLGPGQELRDILARGRGQVCTCVYICQTSTLVIISAYFLG